MIEQDFYGTWKSGTAVEMFTADTYEFDHGNLHYKAAIKSWKQVKNDYKLKRKYPEGFECTFIVTEVFKGNHIYKVGSKVINKAFINKDGTARIDEGFFWERKDG